MITSLIEYEGFKIMEVIRETAPGLLGVVTTGYQITLHKPGIGYNTIHIGADDLTTARENRVLYLVTRRTEP